VGIANQKRDSLTFLVLDLVTTQVVARSELSSGHDSTPPNLRTIMAPDGSTSDQRKTIKSQTDAIFFKIPKPLLKLPRVYPDELLGKTFVHTLDVGKRYCATVVRKIQDHDAENHAFIKFLVELGDGAFDKMIAYGTLCECIEDLEHEYLTVEHKAWIFADVIGHQGLICNSHKDYKGSLYNVLMLWDDGSETYQPLEMVIKDDSINPCFLCSQTGYTWPTWLETAQSC
jgi:hypothetical protein